MFSSKLFTAPNGWRTGEVLASFDMFDGVDTFLQLSGGIYQYGSPCALGRVLHIVEVKHPLDLHFILHLWFPVATPRDLTYKLSNANL